MKPDADHLLRMLAGRLLTHIMPMVNTEYGQSSISLVALLMMAAAEDFDRAAARLIEENKQMRKIFFEALTIITGEPLKQQLEEAAGRLDEDFRVSALDQTNQEMRALLIALQTHIESMEGEGAKRLNGMIWRELAESANRRSYAVWPM